MSRENLNQLYDNQMARNRKEEALQKRSQELENQEMLARSTLFKKPLDPKALIAHVGEKLNRSQPEQNVRCMQFKNNEEKRIDHAVSRLYPSQFMEAPQPMLSLDCPEFLRLGLENSRIKKNGTYMTLHEYVRSFTKDFFEGNHSSINWSHCEKKHQLHVALLENRKKDEASGVDATYKIETKFEASQYKGRSCYLIRMAFIPSSTPGEYTTTTNQGKEDAHVIASHPNNPTDPYVYATSATFEVKSVKNQLHFDLQDSNNPNDQALANYIEESHALIVTATCVPTESFLSCRLVADGPSDLTCDGGGEPKWDNLVSDSGGKIAHDGPTRQSRPATQDIHAMQTHHYSKKIVEGDQVEFEPGSYRVKELDWSIITPMVSSKEAQVAQIVSAMETKMDCLALKLFYKSLKQIGISGDPQQLVEELNDSLEQAQNLNDSLNLELSFPNNCLELKNSLPSSLELAKGPSPKEFVLALNSSLKKAEELCDSLEKVSELLDSLKQGRTNNLREIKTNIDSISNLSDQLLDDVGQATALSNSLKPIDHDVERSLANHQTLGLS